MENEKFLESCERIYTTFNRLTNLVLDDDRAKISELIEGFVNPLIEGFGFDEPCDAWNMLVHIGFAFGFTIASDIEIPPGLVDDVKIIRQVAKEKELLPFFPKERRMP